jgi:hypothetical protein
LTVARDHWQVEADDLEAWLNKQPHLMHEATKVGSRAIDVGEV